METRKDDLDDKLEELSLETNFPFIAFEREGELEIQKRETSPLGADVDCVFGRHTVPERLLFTYVPCPAKCAVCVPCAVKKCGDGPFKCPLCTRFYSRLETDVLRLHGRGLKEPHLT